MSYVVPVHRPSGVRLALKLNFLDSQSETVVVAKANRLEIYSFTPTAGLTLIHSRAVYGYIIMLEAIRPSTSQTDHLFVGTDRYQYFTCSWDAETKQLKTEQSYVDQADRTLRDTRENDRVHIDPTRRYMTLELHDGIVTVIPLVQPSTKKVRRDSSATMSSVPGTLGEPVSVRVEEISTRASAFLDADEDSKGNPQLGLLWEDNQEDPQLKVLELQYSATGEQPTAELVTVAELRQADRLDKGVSHLIPVSLPYGGFLVLGERSIAYSDAELQSFNPQSLGDEATVWSCWTKVDDLRWLLADEYGCLYFLMLIVENNSTVKNWKLDKLDQGSRTSKATCLIYLEEGFVFVGSHSGDSQVVQIREGGVEIVQTFSNIAPILDLQLMDLGRGAEAAVQAGEFSTGQARLVTCSNAWQDGTIRSVRSGVGMEEIGEVGEIPLIEDMWALRTKGENDQQDVLLASFATETRVFKFDADEGVEEVDEYYNLELAEPTLLAANLPDHKLLQVHSSGLRISDLESGMSIFKWKPSDAGAKITGASANDAHVLVVENGRTVHVFHTSGQGESPSVSRTFEAGSQISGITIPQSQSNVCITSFWQTASIALLDLHSLETISTQSLGMPGVDVPRSVLLAQVLPNRFPTLFASMADGTVITFSLDLSKSSLSGMTRILLGSEPVFLKTLPRTDEYGQNLVNVFASCEQPSLIYASEGRIIYSAINSDHAARVCPFDSKAYPGAIAVASPTDLKLAMIDTTRTTQLQTLSIGETVRCLAYEPKLKMFGMCTVGRVLEQDDEQPREVLTSSVKLADEVTFKEIDSFDFEENELVECITTFEQPKNDEDAEEDDEKCMFIVGTSISPDPGAVSQEDQGRILVFSVDSRRPKLNLIAEQSVKGACRSVAVADGMILAGLVKVVVLYTLVPSHERGSRYRYRLKREEVYRTSTNPISLAVQRKTDSRPTTVAVGDIMKSISILTVVPSDGYGTDWELEETARHYATLWTSAVAAIGEGEWAIADMEGNIATLRQNPDAYGEEAKRLEVTGELRLGEVVNKIIPIASGQPVTQMPDQASKGKARTGSTTSAPARSSSFSQDQTGPLIRPQAFIATVEGSIYMLGAINPTYIDALLRIQACLSTRVLAPGYMPWAKYRAWKTDVRESDEPFRFVDGEMVEQGLLNLSDDILEDILRESGLEDSGLTVPGMRKWGEDLRRLY